jgi:hypothetical protein
LLSIRNSEKEKAREYHEAEPVYRLPASASPGFAAKIQSALEYLEKNEMPSRALPETSISDEGSTNSLYYL